MTDSASDVTRDVLTISRLDCVPSVLKILCEATGMGFAAVASVSETEWVACAVHDRIGMGLLPGSRLDIDTTLCKEARLSRRAIVIDRASTDPVYGEHHTPRLYKIESYISVPIVMPDGRYFGNLCAVDRNPANVSDQKIVAMFERFAELIAVEIESQKALDEHQIVLRGEREIGRLREQFIAVLGHDLRNPLTAIAASTAMLRRHDDPQVALLGSRLDSSVRRMSGLIDDTMDFARGRLGTGIDVRVDDIDDLAGALGAIVDEAREGHPDARIELDLSPLPSARGDLRRLQQLLSNLIGNAVTHGDVRQAIRVVIDADGSDVLVSVANGGAPIRDEDLSRLFEPFWRKSSTTRAEGLGLGLFICAQIVKAHHGELTVVSDAIAGTCFTARLPMQSVHREASPRSDRPSSPDRRDPGDANA